MVSAHSGAPGFKGSGPRAAFSGEPIFSEENYRQPSKENWGTENPEGDALEFGSRARCAKQEGSRRDLERKVRAPGEGSTMMATLTKLPAGRLRGATPYKRGKPLTPEHPGDRQDLVRRWLASVRGS